MFGSSGRASASRMAHRERRVSPKSPVPALKRFRPDADPRDGQAERQRCLSRRGSRVPRTGVSDGCQEEEEGCEEEGQEEGQEALGFPSAVASLREGLADALAMGQVSKGAPFGGFSWPPLKDGGQRGVLSVVLFRTARASEFVDSAPRNFFTSKSTID